MMPIILILETVCLVFVLGSIVVLHYDKRDAVSHLTEGLKQINDLAHWVSPLSSTAQKLSLAEYNTLIDLVYDIKTSIGRALIQLDEYERVIKTDKEASSKPCDIIPIKLLGRKEEDI